MENSLDNIQTLIRQEHWTRDTGAFTKAVIQQIDTNLAHLNADEKLELSRACAEHLKASKNSLCALYVIGMLDLEHNSINDAHTMQLIELFAAANKWDMVETLCLKLRTFNSNVDALRTLVDAYEKTSQQEKLIEAWEALVQEDFEEADIALKLANHKKETASMEHAVKDYKKAVNRYLLQKNFPPIRDIWVTLTAHNPADTDFYFAYAQKIERSFSGEKSEELLKILLAVITEKNPEQFDAQITALKHLLKIAPESEPYRTQLVDVYKKKYHDNPKLEDFIRMSNIGQMWRNVHEAVSDFEKHISFFPGSFVFHAQWRIGRIKEAMHQNLVIDFEKKRNHVMDISMAVSSLITLPKSHFWVVRSVLPKEKLRQKILTDPLWCLKCIIKSFGSIDLKNIKSELVPALLTAGEWSSWSAKAKRYLENDPSFGVQAEKTEHYMFSETPVTKSAKVYNLFRKEEKIVDKIKIVRKALSQNVFSLSKANVDNDTFWLIFDYFSAAVKSELEKQEHNPERDLFASESYVNSLFMLDEIAANLQTVKARLPQQLLPVIENASVKNIASMAQTLDIKEYKDRLFFLVYKHKENWKKIFTELFSQHYSRSIVEMLESEKETEFLQEMHLFLRNNFQNNRNAYIWFASSQHEKAWFKNGSDESKDEFKTAATLLRAYASLEKDIQNKFMAAQSKRLMKMVEDYLFSTKDRMKKILQDRTLEDLQYLYSLMSSLSESIPTHVLEAREIIQTRFPEFSFNDTFDYEEAATSTGFFTLESSYKRKQSELQYLHDVEVPENSKEIEKARAFGDLRENAEYKAAMEHQNALNNRAALLQQELSQAKVFDFANASTNSITFGTKVVFENLNDGSEKSYTILGPWESQPSKDIISYLAPIGKKLYRKKVNETCEFTINNNDYKIRIKSIQVLNPASFSA